MLNKQIFKKCRNCGQKAFFHRVFNDNVNRRCTQCGGIEWRGRVPSRINLYNENYFNGNEYISYNKSLIIYRMNMERKLKLVAKYIPNNAKKNQRIMEIGSATGEFIQLAKQYGYTNIVGLEISKYARLKAAERKIHLLNPFSKNTQKYIKRFAPTCLCAWDVWEHLPNPAMQFNKLIKNYPSLDCVAITTVDSSALVAKIRKKNWRQYHPPSHLNYPTTKSLKIFFEKNGFSTRHVTKIGYFRPLADYLSIIMCKKRIQRCDILFKIPIYLNLFDIQLIIATRRTLKRDEKK